jgi:hypothetical protein
MAFPRLGDRTNLCGTVEQMFEENSIGRCWTRLSLNVNTEKSRRAEETEREKTCHIYAFIALPD